MEASRRSGHGQLVAYKVKLLSVYLKFSAFLGEGNLSV